MLQALSVDQPIENLAAGMDSGMCDPIAKHPIGAACRDRCICIDYDRN